MERNMALRGRQGSNLLLNLGGLMRPSLSQQKAMRPLLSVVRQLYTTSPIFLLFFPYDFIEYC